MSRYSSSLFPSIDELRNWHYSDLGPLTEASDSYQSFNAIEQTPIGSAKPFEVLLEEKLAENEDPGQFEEKPKKPFLKKGTGLERYKSGKNGSGWGRQYRKREPFSSGLSLKNLRINHKYESESKMSEFTPLKPPEGLIRPSLLSLKKSPKKSGILKSSPPKPNHDMEGIKSLEWEPLETPQKTFLQKLNVFSKKSSIISASRTINLSFDGHSSPQKPEVDKELLIFEALEQRANNSSFCSTNSSVLRILSSTPQKKQSAGTPEKRALESKLKMLDHKTELINNFISKLKEGHPTDTTLESSEHYDNTEDCSEYESSSPISSPRTWHFDTTLKPPGKDMAVNTTPTPSEFSPEHCKFCKTKELALQQAESKLKQTSEELAKIHESNVVLRRENDETEKQLRKLRSSLEKEKEEWMGKVSELENKLKTERAQFDCMRRSAQNWKKDREELANLRQELIETKELLKLKETKNGTVQARLRSQVKNLEKENSELSGKVEQLTKEKSKLLMSQKMARRPSETKMLNEINKSIAKLTEETLSIKLKQKSEENLCKVPVEVDEKNMSSDNSKFDTFGNLSLERQYENVFGSAKLPKQNVTLTDSGKKEKLETRLEDGSKEIRYSNGNVKTVSPDGDRIVVKYYNGDIKETLVGQQIVKYFYSSNNTWHTTYSDGSEYFEFPSGQSEKRYPDGKCEVLYADGVFQTKYPDGTEIVNYTDKSILTIKSDGTRILQFANGQREIHTNQEKRREYPDGTVKILYPDGSQETRYSSGRIRKKDPQGNLIFDTKVGLD